MGTFIHNIPSTDRSTCPKTVPNVILYPFVKSSLVYTTAGQISFYMLSSSQLASLFELWCVLLQCESWSYICLVCTLHMYVVQCTITEIIPSKQSTWRQVCRSPESTQKGRLEGCEAARGTACSTSTPLGILLLFTILLSFDAE